MQSKYIKCSFKKFLLWAEMYSSSFVCPSNADYLSELDKKFNVESTYDANVGYQILSFNYNLFSSYADSRHAQTNR